MRILNVLAAAAVLSLGAMAARAETLKVGVVPGAYADAVNVAAAEAKAQGIDVKVIEFSDWTTPNVALDAGDIDVNFFQHRPFMENAEKQKGYAFSIVGPVVTGMLFHELFGAASPHAPNLVTLATQHAETVLRGLFVKADTH